MRSGFVATGAAVALSVILSVPIDGAKAAGIITWSNSQTGDDRTVFRVKPGQTVTFSVESEGAEKYIWQVNGETKPQAKGASFKWSVPGKKGLWKIQVISTNKSQERYVAGLVEDFRKFPWGRWDRRAGKWITDKKQREVPETIKDGYYPPKCRKEWIVSTFLKRVKPGESIQKAIDAVPSEGGIVELAPGAHEVKKAIFINKSNVTLQGTHDSEIRILDSTEFTDLIPKGQRYFSSPALFSMNEKWEGHPPLENITFKGFKITSTYTKRRGNLFSACQVNNLTIEGLKNLSFAGHFLTTNGIRDSRGRSYRAWSEGMRIIGNTIQHSRLTSICAKNAVAAYNTLTGPNRSSWGIIFEAGNDNVSIHHNYLENAGVNGNIQIESSGAHVFNNICKGSQAGIWMRGCGSCNVRIENNIITGAKINGIGLRQQKHWKNVRIRNNVIYNCPGYGIYGTEYGYGMTKWRCGDATIINNAIYNCGKGGIAIERARKWTAVYTFHVRNNIIANNKGYGLDFDKGSSNYNNVFNNAKGNYNSVSPGTEDISVRPIFADPVNGDFHLKSKAGRWEPKAKKWIKDVVSSPCIDAGAPEMGCSEEPWPNGSRINIGAYGNTKKASKSGKRQTKTKPCVKLWDTFEKRWPSTAFKNRKLWKQVPYGKTDYKFQGDAVIENDFFFKYFFVHPTAFPLYAKVNGQPRIWYNSLYKVYVDPKEYRLEKVPGASPRSFGRYYGRGRGYMKIIKNTHQEVVVEHQGKLYPVTTIYRVLHDKRWIQVKAVKKATEQGIHGKVRMALAPIEGGNDFVIDSMRDPYGRPKAPPCKMLVCFYESGPYPFMWVITWTSSFAEAAPYFINDTGPKGDTMWWHGQTGCPRSSPGCITSSWAGYGKNGSVVIGALTHWHSWHRDEISKTIKKGETYTSKWKPPYPGKWRMTVRIAEKKYDQGFKYDGQTKFPAKYFSRDVTVGKKSTNDGRFTFKSPMDGVLDYVIMYMYDRTKETPKDILTPMDQYRWTKKNKQEKEK